MTNILDGEVLVTLNGVERTLKPSLDAMTRISRGFAGLANARAALVREDFEAIVTVLRLGLGLTDKEAAGLAKQVYKNGITTDLVIPLIEFVAVLGNGGKSVVAPAPDDEDEAKAEGNA